MKKREIATSSELRSQCLQLHCKIPAATERTSGGAGRAQKSLHPDPDPDPEPEPHPRLDPDFDPGLHPGLHPHPDPHPASGSIVLTLSEAAFA